MLLIGEHGNYPLNEIGQKQYPRYEFFKQIVDVFREDGRTTPVFNDKHLSWKFEWAKEMVDTSKQLKFPFLAGSSLPVTWRMPAIDMPLRGRGRRDRSCVAIGARRHLRLPRPGNDPVHGRAAQRRRDGRRRDARPARRRRLGGDGSRLLDSRRLGLRRLFEACLSRSQTLAQAEVYSHRYPTPEQMQRVGQGAGRLPLRIRRRPEGHDAAA